MVKDMNLAQDLVNELKCVRVHRMGDIPAYSTAGNLRRPRNIVANSLILRNVKCFDVLTML